jgi:dipeptidyl aminopeptidase/acylaminoacyl peptidase
MCWWVWAGYDAGMQAHHHLLPLSRRLKSIAALAAIVVCGLGLNACSTPSSPAPASPNNANNSTNSAVSVASPAPASAPAPSTTLATVPAALRLENVPPLPASLLAAARRYTNVAGHSFVDWHPRTRDMLVAHRAPGASTGQIYLLRAPQAALEPLTDGADPVSFARWEPRDGRYIVFARGSGGDEAYQLFRLDPNTRATEQITPSGQRHAMLGWVKSRALAVVTSVPLDRTAGTGKRTEINTTLSLIDPLKPAERRVLTELPGGGWFGAEVSPDERSLAITHHVSANQSSVWLIDLTNGQRRQVLPATGTDNAATHLVQGWSSDGKSLLITSDRAGEFSELMRWDQASGALSRLTAQTAWDVDGVSTNRDGSLLATRVNVDGRDELRLMSADGSARALEAQNKVPAGSVSAAKFHAVHNELAIVTNSTQGPSQIHTLDVQTGASVAWTTPAGVAGLNLQNLPEQQIVRWQSFDGRSISGVLSLPPARFTGPRPVVMQVHGGPEGQAKQGWQGRYNHLLQELGVAVLEPNVRGSSGYGKTFLALDNGRLREDSVKDMDSAITWMAKQPHLDAKRVLVVGGSYGGYMALAASTLLADRIAGAVSSVGISNFVSFLENTETYRRDLRRVEYGDERDPAMRSFLQSISPLNRVDKISKPLMVVQGKNDPRVPYTESEQIVRSLQARQVPVWYMLADNEGHGFARRENADYYFAALCTFIEQTLKP